MFLGVPCEEFWHGDYTRLKYYIKAHDLKRQHRSEELWMQGLYNFNAFSAALSNLHFDGKHHKMNKYLDEPIRLLPVTEEEQKAKALEERRKTIAFFDNLARKSKKEGA